MQRCALIVFLNSHEPERVPLRPCCVATVLLHRRQAPRTAEDDRLPSCAALPLLEPVP